MKIILASIGIFLSACAATPPAPDAKVIEPLATSEPAEGTPQNAADRRFAEEARGYRLVERDGQKYYCRTERASGSHLKAMSCISESELRTRVENAEIYRKRSKPALCAPNDPRCGGA